MKAVLAALGLAAILAGCVPASGPSGRSIIKATRDGEITLTRLDSVEVARSSTERAVVSEFGRRFQSAPHRADIIRPGQTIAVTVFDTGEQGLLSVADSMSLPLGEYLVARDGTVRLPFAGRVEVGGFSVQETQAVLTRRMRDIAVEPFVNVSIVRADRETYAVQGDVNDAGLYPLTGRGERVLDALAVAGGPTAAPGETKITLLRNGRRGMQRFNDLLISPADNIAVRPGDTLIVNHDPASFIAEGAVRSPGEFRFAEGELNLMQALARAGGIADGQANAGAVFVLRRTTPEVVETAAEAGPGLTDRLAAAEAGIEERAPGALAIGETVLGAAAPQAAGTIGTATDAASAAAGAADATIAALSGPPEGREIFLIDMDEVESRFIASNFDIVDGDIVYVGNARLADFGKLLQIFDRPPSLPVPDPRG
ncbi:MAG: polysaccharide biosynthesis/export family protein [Pseudomonadota bacterium]